MTMVGELCAHAAITEHYTKPEVRARIDQFFGRRSDGSVSAADAARSSGPGGGGAGYRLSADASISADDVAVLQNALEALFGRHPDLRGAAIPVAFGQAMVGLFTARGWVPALVRAAELKCWKVLLARLESAMAEGSGPRQH